MNHNHNHTLPAPTAEELLMLRALVEMAADPNNEAGQVLNMIRNLDARLADLHQQVSENPPAPPQVGTNDNQPSSASDERAYVASQQEYIRAIQEQTLQLQQALQTVIQRLSSGGNRSQIPLPLSPKFKGDEIELSFDEFQAKLWSVFSRFPSVSTDEEKVIYAFQSMEGSPSRLLAPLFNLAVPDTDGLLSDYKKFMLYLQATFGDQLTADEASRKLQRLRQTGPMVDYLTQFRILSSRVNWNESALRDRFKDGLSTDIKNLLVSQWHTFTTLRDIQTAAMSAYQNWVMAYRSRQRPLQQQQHVQHQQQQRRPQPAASTAASDSSAMDVDTVRFRRLSPQEKQRRRDNHLCLYCGGADHFANACPLKRIQQVASVSFLEDSENASA